MSVGSGEKLGIMQPGAPGSHRMILDFSHIILGFESMHATVERAEKMVAEMKARTEVLEAELRKKTNIEDRVKAAEGNLQSLSTSVEAQFSSNDRRHQSFAQDCKVWLEKLSEGQVSCESAIQLLKNRVDALERRADDHDKAIARAKELGMELQDAFAYIQKFSTSSAAPMPPRLETPSGHSAAAIVLVLKEFLDRIDKEETSSTDFRRQFLKANSELSALDMAAKKAADQIKQIGNQSRTIEQLVATHPEEFAKLDAKIHRLNEIKLDKQHMRKVAYSLGELFWTEAVGCQEGETRRLCMNGKDVMQEFCDPKEWQQLMQIVSKRMTVESSMKKKQIVVQERCLACGNGSPALPPAKAREDKEHASGPAGFKATGESRHEATIGAVMRPQSPEKGGDDVTDESKGLPDIDKYRYKNSSKKEEIGTERVGKVLKFEPMQEKISSFEVNLPPRPTTQAFLQASSSSPLRSVEKRSGMLKSLIIEISQHQRADTSIGYRSMESGSGAFLADMKVGVPSKGLTVSDRISDVLHDADQNFSRSMMSSSPSSLYSDSRVQGLMASIDKQATFVRAAGANGASASSGVFGVSSPSETLAIPVQKVVVLQGSGDGRGKSAAGVAASTPNKFAKT